jgi:hypothetical protein
MLYQNKKCIKFEVITAVKLSMLVLWLQSRMDW